ncbi:MAG: hypothetical protein H6815_05545 [Phycisphaeraceae bacterium]|nr:hypothetical protein [Phycisphaerales bacterium]MCB9859902.1 hypothetical protein [Phycisphaeraceae bacterium]
MTKTKTLALTAGICGALAGSAVAQTSTNTMIGNEVLSNAANQSSLLGNSQSTLTAFGMIQFRFMVAALESGDDDVVTGFQTRRTRAGFKGDIDDQFSYYVQFEFSRSSGSAGLLDAFLDIDMGEGANLRVGQFKTGASRENSISSSKGLFADTSIVRGTFSPGRSQGLAYMFENPDSNMRGAIAVTDGFGTSNTDITSGSEGDIAITGNVDYSWTGSDFKIFDDFTSGQGAANGQDYHGLVGGAVHFQSGGSTVGTTDATMFWASGYVQVEGDGWNGFAEIDLMQMDPDGGDSTLDIGFLAQGGYMFDENNEGILRIEGLIPDGDRSGDDMFLALTFGMNHYFNPADPHSAKFTVDVMIPFEDAANCDIVTTSTTTGLFASSESGDFAARAQVQGKF